MQADFRDLRRMWAEYIEHRTADPRVRAVVHQSWERCRQYPQLDPSHMAPQTPDLNRLIRARIASAPLLAAATPYLDSLHSLLGDEPHLITLCDSSGLVLWLRGDPKSLKLGESTNIFEGASWSEEQVGCNGAGTALAIDQPVVLIGPEHYMADYANWTCVGVPIHDGAGKLMGALDLSIPNEQVNVSAWGWALTIGEAVEQSLRTVGAPASGSVTDLFDMDEPFQAIKGILTLLVAELPLSPSHLLLLAQAYSKLDVAARAYRKAQDK